MHGSAMTHITGDMLRGRDAQLFDLISAALPRNAETWAHLVYRHPDAAAGLAEELALLPVPLAVGSCTQPRF